MILMEKLAQNWSDILYIDVYTVLLFKYSFSATISILLTTKSSKTVKTNLF